MWTCKEASNRWLTHSPISLSLFYNLRSQRLSRAAFEKKLPLSRLFELTPFLSPSFFLFFFFLSFFRWTRQRNYKWKENNFWKCFVFRLFCSLLFFFLSLSCVSFYFFYSGRRNFFKPATLESNRKYTSLTIKTSHTIKTSLTIKTSDTIKTLHRASGVGGGISISIPPGRSVGPRRTNLFD